MADVRILNRSHTVLTLSEPNPNPDKPGDAPPLRSVSLAGNGAVSTVDGEVWAAWKKGNKDHHFLTSGILEEVGEDHEGAEEFGFQPALDAVVKDKDQAKMAKAGVVPEAEAGGLTSSDMTHETDGTPPGDDPGEPRHASQPGEPEPSRRGRRT